MKVLEREDNVLDPERLFFSSIKSPATKRVYTTYLQRFMKFVNCKTINNLIADFKDADPKDIERRLIEFIIQMKEEEGMNFRSIHNYVAPVISFYKINDLMLNTKKINRFMPPKTRVRKNRGYTHEEIQKFLDISDERMRAVILLLVSSGCPVGSICTLHVRDLEKVGDSYKVTIYENQEEEYFTFITPEASRAIESYLEMRQRYGEPIGPDSILIREQFDIRDQFSIASPKAINTLTLTGKLAQLAERAGIREKTPLKVGEKGGSLRKAVPLAHGFRKSFTTFALNSKMDIIKRRMLEGHNIGIDEHYAKPSETDLEEYQKAIDLLTIDQSQRLQRKVETLELEKNQFEQLRAKIESLEAKMNSKY
jgi:integrase